MTRITSALARGLSTLCIAASLLACSGSAVSPATVIADLQSGFAALNAQMPGLANVDPGLAVNLQPLVTQGTNLLTNLSAASPQMTTTLGDVDAVINAILTTAGSSTLVPAPYNLLVEALAVVAPEIEAVVNPIILKSGIASAKGPGVAVWLTYEHPHVADAPAARAVFAKYRGH